jgi:hypothetical protein
MSMNFDDERLPTEPFKMLCPRCRQSVTITPPSKEEPRLPVIHSVVEPLLEGTSMQTQIPPDPLRALAELLLSGLKPSNTVPSEVETIHRRRILLCLEDHKMRDKLRSSLDATRYEVFSADLAPEAIEIIHESRAEAIVISPTFASEQQGGGAMMHYVNSLTPQVRRRTFVVLVSPQVRTLDTYLAFANGVNLTLHPEDVGAFQPIFERSVRDFNELYRPLNQAMQVAPY